MQPLTPCLSIFFILRACIFLFFLQINLHLQLLPLQQPRATIPISLHALGCEVQPWVPALAGPSQLELVSGCTNTPSSPHHTTVLCPHPAGAMSTEIRSAGRKLGQEEDGGSRMGTMLAKSRALCAQPGSPPAALDPARVSAPMCINPAGSCTQHPAPIPRQLLPSTVPHTAVPCSAPALLLHPEPGQLHPLSIGDIVGDSWHPQSQVGAGEDRAKIAPKWQEDTPR